MAYREIDALSLYLAEVDKIAPLPVEEEIILRDCILFAIGNEQDRLRNELIRHNLRFVISEAKKFQNRGVDLQDLIAEGNKGMVKASKRYDYSRKTKFISYAVWWIRVAIYAVLQEAFQYYKHLSDTPLEEIPTVIDDDTRALGERFFRADFGKAFETASDETLSDREIRILKLYFGLYNEGTFTLDDIADMEEITRERIRQIKVRALEKLLDSEPTGLLQLVGAP